MPHLLIDCPNHPGVDLFFHLNGSYPYAQELPALPENFQQAIAHDNLLSLLRLKDESILTRR